MGTNNIDFYSPLRYPGGKGKVVDCVKSILRENSLLDCTYVEPYVGGGSVALGLLFDEYVSKIIINDKDRSIYAFWYSVLKDTSALCAKILETPTTIDSWHEQKEIQKDKGQVNLLNLGFSTFFLNRTNRSGILKAGVIGGLQQTGNYLINARYNKEDLINRIQRIADYKDRIEVCNVDAADLVTKLSKESSNKMFYYLDPPYYKNGKGLYMNYYKDSDHKSIAEVITNMQHCAWIVSYDKVEFIEKLYAKYRQVPFELNYSVANGHRGTEIMIFSDKLSIPQHKLFRTLNSND